MTFIKLKFNYKNLSEIRFFNNDTIGTKLIVFNIRCFSKKRNLV